MTAVDDWVVDRPGGVEAVHRAFAGAGAKIVLTATFRTYPHVRDDWATVADRAVELAGRAGTMVWGSLGPGAKPGEWAQLAARIRPGVTGLVLETFVDGAECL